MVSIEIVAGSLDEILRFKDKVRELGVTIQVDDRVHSATIHFESEEDYNLVRMLDLMIPWTQHQGVYWLNNNVEQ